MSTLILNHFEIFGGEVLIMSFQTNKNGTLNLSTTIDSGTLRWVIDGVEYITNSPSVALTGSLVDVEVFSNTVPPGETLSFLNWAVENIIGEIDFTYFTITAGNFNYFGNSGLTGCIFSGIIASIMGNHRGSNCDLISHDLSVSTITTKLLLFGNSNLQELSDATYGVNLNELDISNCDLDITSINNIFSTLNTQRSVTPPTANLVVDVSGGTNASPTGGSSNTDLVNLRDVVYPNAGFTFTATIN